MIFIFQLIATNKKVIERAGQITSLGSLILTWKLKYLGHVMRHKGMEKKMMVGMVECIRRRGRQWIRWNRTMDREGWRDEVNTVTTGRTRPEHDDELDFNRLLLTCLLLLQVGAPLAPPALLLPAAPQPPPPAALGLRGDWVRARHMRLRSAGQKTLASAPPNQSFIAASFATSARNLRTGATNSAVMRSAALSGRHARRQIGIIFSHEGCQWRRAIILKLKVWRKKGKNSNKWIPKSVKKIYDVDLYLITRLPYHVTGVSRKGQHGSGNVDILNFWMYLYRLIWFI